MAEGKKRVRERGRKDSGTGSDLLSGIGSQPPLKKAGNESGKGSGNVVAEQPTVKQCPYPECTATSDTDIWYRRASDGTPLSSLCNRHGNLHAGTADELPVPV